jgi:tetratricopeptide (TPR) repeat protein
MTKINLALLTIFSLLVINNSYSHGIDDDIRSGMNDIYNLKFEDAESKFIEIQKRNPDDIKGYFYQAVVYYYRALPTRDDKMFDKFIDLTDKILDMCDTKLDKNENDIETLYYKGLTHSYRSLIFLNLNKSLLKAASNGNDGYRILSDVIQKKPDFYDAYMGLGLYKIAIGFVPEKFQWLLSIIGFDGNIKNGLDLLKTAMDKGRFTRVDAKVYYAISSITEKEDENNVSIKLSKELYDEFPHSPIFNLIYSTMLLERMKVDESIEYCKKALTLNTHSLQPEIKKGTYALLGNAYFRKNDFVNAAASLEEHLKYVNKEDRYNVSCYTLGISYEMSGDRTKAIESYSKARNTFIDERDGEAEKLFYRLCMERVQKPLRDIDSISIIAMNLREAGNFDASIEKYNSLLDAAHLSKFSTDDDKAYLYSNIGHAYLMKKDYNKAIEFFNKTVALSPKTDLWHVPHSYFELGKIYWRKGDKQKATEYFEKIYDYSDYDFKNFLEMRLANFKAKN